MIVPEEELGEKSKDFDSQHCWTITSVLCVFLSLGVHVCLLSCFSDLNKNPVEGFSAGLADDEDIYKWEVLIIGPPDTL